MRRIDFILFAVFVIWSQGLAAQTTVIPGPASFGRVLFLNDSQVPGNEVDTGQLTFSQAFSVQENYAPGAGGNVTIASQSNVAASGAPFTKAEVLADYDGSYGVTGSASATLSYQIVVTGGIPGASTPVNFGTFGELTNTSACAGCPNDSWLSASALLRLRDPASGTNYFLLGGATDTVFQTGRGTTSIAFFPTLNLPIDVPLDVIIGVTTYGYTQDTWLGQPVGASRSFAFLDPTFEPLESGITVLQSSNLVPIPEPSAYVLMIAGLLTVGATARRRRLQS